MLSRVHAFLNTLDERHFRRRGRRHAGGDILVTHADLETWLAGHDLLPRGESVDDETVALARALRHVLRATLAARAGHTVESEPDTSGILRALPVRLALDPAGQAALRPVDSGGRGALAALTAEIAAAAATGQWARLKMCGHSDCHWVFYDGSRNGRGRWCAMGTCGNRAKTHAYRQRHAVQPGS